MRSILAFVTLALVCSSGIAEAQRAPVTWRSTAKNAVFIELFGNTGGLSYNLDRKLNQNVTARFAYGRFYSLEFGDQPAKVFRTYTVMLNALAVGPIWWHELGIGFMRGSWYGTCCMAPGLVREMTATWGFRRQPDDGGFVFRVGFTPGWVFSSADLGNDAFRMRGGVSVGWAF